MRDFWTVTGVLLTIAAAAPGSASVKLNRISYHGWSSTYRLSNGTIWEMAQILVPALSGHRSQGPFAAMAELSSLESSPKI